MGQDIAAIADGNPYSSEFDVKVRPAYASADSIASFAAFIADMPGVQEVNSESTVIEGHRYHCAPCYDGSLGYGPCAIGGSCGFDR